MLTSPEAWGKLHEALEAMPVKELMCGAYYPGGFDKCGCAIGELAKFVSPEGARFAADNGGMISNMLVYFGFKKSTLNAIVLSNDDCGEDESPRERWIRMHELSALHMRHS